ncbi:MAG: PfkB family carbohydrate kinase [Planctomycetota bacterium]|jgi:sugar/nucleoside kinase (ribokinase family)|nr:PfkB family carbohydrate kinase [Planctomycetota bacterium]
MPETGCDILGFGVAAIDDVFAMDAFPRPGEKSFFETYMRVGGGQTATALVAAARLGRRCVYGGHLGRNDLSDRVRDVFKREGVGCRPAVEYPEASPTHTLVLVDRATGERSNIANVGGVESAELGEWDRELIAGAKCLLVDQSIPRFQVRAAALALARGIPVVGDLESVEGESRRELCAMANHLILPLNVARRELGASDPEEAVRTMMRGGGRVLACVTDGERGAWYADADAPDAIRRQPAIAMPRVVDTNGCGDVFHGAYAAALVEGRPLAERMRRACAAAAMKTRKPGGQAGAPTSRELEAFLAGS